MRQEIGLFIVERRCFFEVQNRQYANGKKNRHRKINATIPPLP